MTIKWLQRAKRCDTQVAKRRRWDSRCRRFAIVESVSPHFGRWFQGIQVIPNGEVLVKRSRSRRVVERALDRIVLTPTLGGER